MALNVEVREVEAQPVMAIRVRTTKGELEAQFGVVLPEVYGYVVSKGGQLVGMPFAHYFAFGDDGVEFEAGAPVSGPMEETDRVKNSELPGGIVAVTRHEGPYETLDTTYGALRKWIEDSEYDVGDSCWEVYVTDPGAEPDSSKWVTEIYYRLKET